MNLTEHDRWSLINALMTASQTYREDAEKLKEYAPFTADHFLIQASEAERLLAVIEDASRFHLGDS